MSRNLMRTDCDFCEGAVVPVEPWRPIERKDCGGYFGEYEGMPVAVAKCADCEAQYLAWGWRSPREPESAPTVRDLSFRSTFDDEPGSADYPRWKIRVVRERVGPWEATKP